MKEKIGSLKGEWKKITWPGKPEAIKKTGTVLAVGTVLGMVICLLDFGFQVVFDLLATVL